MQIRQVVEYTKTGVQYCSFRKANNFMLGRIRPVTPNYFFAYLTYLYFCNSDSFVRLVFRVIFFSDYLAPEKDCSP